MGDTAFSNRRDAEVSIHSKKPKFPGRSSDVSPEVYEALSHRPAPGKRHRIGKLRGDSNLPRKILNHEGKSRTDSSRRHIAGF
jgi:hypothetical protein